MRAVLSILGFSRALNLCLVFVIFIGIGLGNRVLKGQRVDKDSTEWVGEWRDSGNLQYAFTLKLKPHGDGRMTGIFEWKLIWTSLYEHKSKVGASAKEHLVGRYDVKENSLRLVGIGQEDPADIISMDSYIIHVSADHKRIEGLNVKPENYHGSLFGVRMEPKPKPVVAVAKAPTSPKEPSKPLPTSVAKVEPKVSPVPIPQEALNTPKPTGAASKSIADVSKRVIVTKKEIKATESQVRIGVYDESIVDGDVVSLSWNGVWVVRYYRIATAPKELVLDLLPGENILVMYAENLGKYPPNTAAIAVQHGKKIEQFILNSDMGKSEAIKIFKE
jgi:hypothetical protein